MFKRFYGAGDMGKYKHGKQKSEMEKETFYEIMEHGSFVKPLMHRAFLALLYYVGCRKAEALELTTRDFRITDDFLYVNIPAKKHGIERSPFKLNRKLPYVELILKRVKSTMKSKRVFPFNPVTAWLIVKRVAPKKYPHYFRLNRTVKFLNNPNVTLNEIRQWMAWKSIDTVNNYLGYSERTIGKLSQQLE